MLKYVLHYSFFFFERDLKIQKLFIRDFTVHICDNVKLRFSSVILTSFRQGVTLSSLKRPPRVKLIFMTLRSFVTKMNIIIFFLHTFLSCILHILAFLRQLFAIKLYIGWKWQGNVKKKFGT